MHTTPEAALKKGWGYDSFRPLQREAIDAALSGRDCLVVLPTGGGKSLCYQVPSACGHGLTLVVSPLIALMDDQVAAAREAGLRAAALHSGLGAAEKRAGADALWAGALDLLYLSPERLLTGDLLPALEGKVRLAAVDEAHCVSHWGHDFRPEYRQLADALDRFPEAARMALTATATAPVRGDIAAQLGLRDPLCLVGHPDRPNLVYRALPRRDQTAQILDVIERHPGEGGLVYAQTRREVERLAAALAARGVHCAPYHAGLGQDDRRRAQEDFVAEKLDVVVATIAFGMGIDRSNVRFVAHANAPRSVEHYQQESGRAGRDGLPAECVLLFSAADLVTHRRLALMDNPPPDRVRALERQLKEIGRYASAPVCRHRLLTEHFGAVYEKDACSACDVCLGETRGLSAEDALLTAKKVISAVWRTEGRFGAGYVSSLLVGKAEERMVRYGHDKLQVFGLLRDAGEPAVRTWIDQLVVQGFLAVKDDGDYPLIVMTESGRALCRDEGSVRLTVPAPPSAGKRRKKGKAAAGPADSSLFERLRALRRKLAASSRVPPYLVFHDASLQEMAAVKPATLEALAQIKGVGESKLKRYGAAVLAVIAGRDD